jgi:hypothetical protein
MDRVSKQSQKTDNPTSTSVLGLILLLAILTITTWLTIRSSSEPGGTLHGAKVWSRNYFYTRAKPLSAGEKDMPDSDNSDDNVPYGTPGLFDDQPSLKVQTDPGEQDVPDSDSDKIEDDVPYGPGVFDRPLLVPRAECSCESPHSDR